MSAVQAWRDMWALKSYLGPQLSQRDGCTLGKVLVGEGAEKVVVVPGGELFNTCILGLRGERWLHRECLRHSTMAITKPVDTCSILKIAHTKNWTLA